jgi:hypothetical protein
MRLLPSAIVLTAFVVLGPGSAIGALPQNAASTDTTRDHDKPLTGRAIPCRQGKIETFDCLNVELLSYLPKGVIGESSGYDLWG